MTLAGDTRFHLRLAAEPHSVSVARHAAGGFAEEHGADADAVALAVSEAVSNAVTHAFGEGTWGSVEVAAELAGPHLLVTVTDDGCGIKPDPRSSGVGFGLAMMASLAEETEIGTSNDGGTRLRLRFPARADSS